MEFPRQEYWSGLPFLQGILPTRGLNPRLLHCRRTLYWLSHQGSSPGACNCRELSLVKYQSYDFRVLRCPKMISLLIPKVLHFIISTLLFKDLILIKCRFPLGKVPHQLFIPQSEKNNLRTSFIKQYRGWIQGSWETCDPWNKGLRGFDTKLHLSPGFSWIQLHYICFKDSSSSKWNVFLGKLSF